MVCKHVEFCFCLCFSSSVLQKAVLCDSLLKVDGTQYQNKTYPVPAGREGKGRRDSESGGNDRAKTHLPFDTEEEAASWLLRVRCGVRSWLTVALPSGHSHPGLSGPCIVCYRPSSLDT